LITYEVKGKQFIAAAAGDNNPTLQKSPVKNEIVVLGLDQ